MRNEFTAIVERAGRWHIAHCPEILGGNGQGWTKAAALKTSPKRSPSFLRIAARLPLEARRAVALSMDESSDRRRRSDSEAHRDPGRAGPKDLPGTVSARDWSMRLPN